MYKIRIPRMNINIILLAIVMFSELSFYTEEKMNLYIATLGCVVVCMFFLLLFNASILTSIFQSRFFWWVTCFYLFISVDAYVRGYGVFNYQRTLANWILYLCVWTLLYKKEHEEIMDTFCSACEIAAVAGCIYIIINERESLLSFARIGDTLSGNVNTVGMCLGIFSLAIMYQYIRRRNIIHLLLYMFTSLFMLLTGSKKTFLTIILAVLMYLFYGGLKLKRVLIILVLGIAAIYMIFNNVYLYNIIGSRTIDFLGNLGFKIGTFQYSFSTDARESLISTAMTLFKQKPLFGWGYSAVAEYSPYHFYAHNNFLELMACNGLLGLTLYYVFPFRLFKKVLTYNLDKQHKIYLLILLANAIVNDIAIVTYTTSGALPYLVFLFLGLYLKQYIKNGNRLSKKYTIRSGKEK